MKSKCLGKRHEDSSYILWVLFVSDFLSLFFGLNIYYFVYKLDIGKYIFYFKIGHDITSKHFIRHLRYFKYKCEASTILC